MNKHGNEKNIYASSRTSDVQGGGLLAEDLDSSVEGRADQRALERSAQLYAHLFVGVKLGGPKQKKYLRK